MKNEGYKEYKSDSCEKSFSHSKSNGIIVTHVANHFHIHSVRKGLMDKILISCANHFLKQDN